MTFFITSQRSKSRPPGLLLSQRRALWLATCPLAGNVHSGWQRALWLATCTLTGNVHSGWQRALWLVDPLLWQRALCLGGPLLWQRALCLVGSRGRSLKHKARQPPETGPESYHHQHILPNISVSSSADKCSPQLTHTCTPHNLPSSRNGRFPTSDNA